MKIRTRKPVETIPYVRIGTSQTFVANPLITAARIVITNYGEKPIYLVAEKKNGKWEGIGVA